MQLIGLAPTQLPAWQASLRVQAFPSSQAAPLVLAGFEHFPVDGLYMPGSWQASSAVQVTALLPTQRPVASQVSVWVQALPSLHEICCWHPRAPSHFPVLPH